MSRSIIKKALNTEKSFKGQDNNEWTFVVDPAANKLEIKAAIEALFGVEVGRITTTRQPSKLRKLKASKVHTRRAELKIARITLKDKKKKIDFTKILK